jgi:hypothetical protein
MNPETQRAILTIALSRLSPADAAVPDLARLCLDVLPKRVSLKTEYGYSELCHMA